MKENLEKIILELINSKKEGVFWDFKQEHHQNNIDLIHDIICLANANYRGNRYLIFGVNDEFDVVGLQETKKQSDVICLLRDANFADGIFPDISLDSFELKNKNIQVLTIYNTCNKPYYLIKEKIKQNTNTKLSAGTIYTRVMDTNTPKNSVATSKDIEHMWKERFGLIQTPLDRFKIYLQDYENWENKSDIRFYKPFPEFTIKSVDNNIFDGNEKNELARGEVGYLCNLRNSTYVEGLYYFNTLLKEIVIVVFDGGKKTIVNPEWEAIGKGRIYYYLKDSLQYSYQQFLSFERDEDFSKNIKSTKGDLFDIPLFYNKENLKEFLNDIKNEIDCTELEPAFNEDEQSELFYKYLEFYKEWKKQK